MLLKKIILKDFRQFIGEQKISFSTDLDMNITVIMGENGSGKTSLAQAFTWCLYNATDFEDQSVLNKKVAQRMPPNSEETVRVEISLIHNDIDYTMIRKQRYTTDNLGNLKRPDNSEFEIVYKNTDGQQKYLKDLEADIQMKEILPKELSRYFFFDGERIGNMSKEIRKGKSKEFAEAVKNLLGLSAITSALDHLKGKTSRLSVIRTYDKSYDATSDIKIDEYTKKIEKYDKDIESIEQRLYDISNEEVIAQDICIELEKKIKENEDSERLFKERTNQINKRESLYQKRADSITSLLKEFNIHALDYFSKKLINDALKMLSEEELIDTGIPDIHARTIEFLMKRGTCICGSEIKVGNDAFKELNKVLEYIPPKSIGTSISEFVRECELKSQGTSMFFDNISEKYTAVRDFDILDAEIDAKIKVLEAKLEGMESVGTLQTQLMSYENALRKLGDERDTLNRDLGRFETDRNKMIEAKNDLTMRDEKNRKINIYKAYAQYMYDTLNETYNNEEEKVREKLEENVNHIFREIYNGGFSLAIDEKYNIQILVNDFDGYSDEIETSTAQSISVIFAFIAGVIKMARESRKPENEMLITEPYPLVMDAPLSAFDKTRIRAVCDVLPNVAEQVVIFIKDTDGEIAESYMADKIGQRYLFDKKNEFETYLIERGDSNVR